MISYKYMGKGKQAISVTLDADNLTWLKGRAGAGPNHMSQSRPAGGSESGGVPIPSGYSLP